MPSLTPRFSAIKAYIVLLLLILWTLVCLLIYGVAVVLPLVQAKHVIPFYHTGLCFFMGVKVECIGEPSKHISTLFISNHVSYLDIPVLGSLINGFFVAKSEIAHWPVINRLAKIQNTIFIERRASKAKSQIAILRETLKQGNRLILFPEGTSTNGAEVLPLKSSLFSAVETDEADILIQPVSVVYSQYKGKGMDQAVRDNFAWYADMPFGPHIFNVLGLAQVTAVVTFSEPIRLSDYSNRKACALASWEIMNKTFEDAFQASGSTR